MSCSIIAISEVSVITVYADILFLINFSMDFLTLFLTSKVLHKPPDTIRLALAAGCGGIAATVDTCCLTFTGRFFALIHVAGGFALAFLMTLLAFGKDGHILRTLRNTVLVWGIGTLLGGVMSTVLSLGEPVFTDAPKSSAFLTAFVVCFALVSLLIRLFSARLGKKTAAVEMTYRGREILFTALVDSGNLAREPISSLPVIIVSGELVPEFDRESEEHFRIIPIRTVNGERILYGFIPEQICVDGRRREAVVAVDHENKRYGELDGLIPASLVQ